jgi:hypothetical protein
LGFFFAGRRRIKPELSRPRPELLAVYSGRPESAALSGLTPPSPLQTAAETSIRTGA